MSTAERVSLSDIPQSIPRRENAEAQSARRRQRARMRIVRQALLGLVAVASVLGLALALRPRPVLVDLANATRGPLTVAVEETGMTRVKDRYVVSVPVTGNVSRILFDPGDTVKEGDVIAEIAPATAPLLDERTRAEAEARLGAASSALGQTQAQEARAYAARQLSLQELERTRRLAATGTIAAEALEQTEFLDRMRLEELNSAIFAGKVAEEEVRRARAALGPSPTRSRDRHLAVRAPVSGVILRVHQRSAGVLAAGAPLVEIGDAAVLECVVDLLTTDAVRVAVGTPTQLQGWGGEHPLAGRVRQVEPSAFTRQSALGVDEQRVNVVIAFTEPRERWAVLRDGYRVEARLVLWHAEDVLKVPQGAVFRHGDGWAVYRADGDRARLTRVELGHRGETEVEILSGLGAGATVAVHPGDRVEDGVRIEAP